MSDQVEPPIGTFCLVLHSHLPWLAGHGTWPVGEEWLHQAWAQSYGPVLQVLTELAESGRRDLLTLGMTPVLASQLDDPYCLTEHETWLSIWRERAIELAASKDPARRDLARYEFQNATRALRRHRDHWSHGGANVLRALLDSGAVELLGGPAAHPFQPLLPERIVDFSLRVGLDDHRLRLDQKPAGIWAPECAYRPGLEQSYARHGITHFMVDGPTLQHVGAPTSTAYTVGDSDVVAFGRDLEVSYRVWSPRRGYPGGSWYRDFHTYDHESGFKSARVTSRSTASQDKAPYDPVRAQQAVSADVADFVGMVRQRLQQIRERDGKPGLVVAAYDTELFGHWWHEGPLWLKQVLTALPAAGVKVTTLRGALDDGLVAGPVHPEEGSWGRRKDFHVWDSPATAGVVALNQQVADEITRATDAMPHSARSPRHDDAAREALLALQSDWAFIISHESAVDYARGRAFGHAHRMRAILDSLKDAAAVTPSTSRRADSRTSPPRPGTPFGHLDARLL